MAAPREKPWVSLHTMFCQGIAPKKFADGDIIPPTPPRCSGTLITFCRAGCKATACRLLKAAKFFAPLTTMCTHIINTRAEQSPAPRLNCITTSFLLLSAEYCRLSIFLFLSAYRQLLLPPLIRGQIFLLALFLVCGGMRSFGVQGETRKIPPAAFVSFGAQKKHYSAAADCSPTPAFRGGDAAICGRGLVAF